MQSDQQHQSLTHEEVEPGTKKQQEIYCSLEIPVLESFDSSFMFYLVSYLDMPTLTVKNLQLRHSAIQPMQNFCGIHKLAKKANFVCNFCGRIHI